MNRSTYLKCARNILLLYPVAFREQFGEQILLDMEESPEIEGPRLISLSRLVGGAVTAHRQDWARRWLARKFAYAHGMDVVPGTLGVDWTRTAQWSAGGLLLMLGALAVGMIAGNVLYQAWGWREQMFVVLATLGGMFFLVRGTLQLGDRMTRSSDVAAYATRRVVLVAICFTLPLLVMLVINHINALNPAGARSAGLRIYEGAFPGGGVTFTALFVASLMMSTTAAIAMIGPGIDVSRRQSTWSTWIATGLFMAVCGGVIWATSMAQSIASLWMMGVAAALSLMILCLHSFQIGRIMRGAFLLFPLPLALGFALGIAPDATMTGSLTQPTMLDVAQTYRVEVCERGENGLRALEMRTVWEKQHPLAASMLDPMDVSGNSCWPKRITGVGN